MARLLVIEDQIKLRRNLQEMLASDGHDVVTAGTGEEGFYCATTQPIDAVLLDLSLPGRDGLEILADLRNAGFDKPILILTARDAVEDRATGLDQGGDDYLVKPFAQVELLARIRALLRRSKASPATILRCADLEVDLLRRRVVRKGIAIELSQREFDLLEYLLRHKNSNVTRDMLARDVWQEPGGVLTNAIDVCMNGLRRKVEVAGSPPLILTVRGVGYTAKDSS
ncbi:MAG: response regulator transcription factor [Pirellulales bacterium]